MALIQPSPSSLWERCQSPSFLTTMEGARRSRDWAENGLYQRVVQSTDGCLSGLRYSELDGVSRVSAVRFSSPQSRARSSFNVYSCSRTCAREFRNHCGPGRFNILVVGRVADSVCPRWHLGGQCPPLMESTRWRLTRRSSKFLAFCTPPQPSLLSRNDVSAQ